MPSVQSVLDAYARARAAPLFLADKGDDPDGLWTILPDGRRVLRDGVRYSVPAILADSSDPDQQASLEARFQMGLLSDAELKDYVQQAREAAMDATANAWRNPAGRDQSTVPQEQGRTAAVTAKQAELREINQAIVSDAEAAAVREAADEAFDRETERRSQAWRRATW